MAETLAIGKMRLEQRGDEVSIVIPCPTTEEADLTYSAILQAWSRTGKLVLSRRQSEPDPLPEVKR